MVTHTHTHAIFHAHAHAPLNRRCVCTQAAVFRSAPDAAPSATPFSGSPRAAASAPGGTGAAAGLAQLPLPADWRRLHATAGLTDFAAVPILDASGGVVAAISAAGPAAPGAADATPRTATSNGVINSGAGGCATPFAAAAQALGNGSGGLAALGLGLGGAAAGGGGGAGSSSLGLSLQGRQLQRLGRVVGLAFFGDGLQLGVWQEAAAALVGVQRADSLQVGGLA